MKSIIYLLIDFLLESSSVNLNILLMVKSISRSALRSMSMSFNSAMDELTL